VFVRIPKLRGNPLHQLSFEQETATARVNPVATHVRTILLKHAKPRSRPDRTLRLCQAGAGRHRIAAQHHAGNTAREGGITNLASALVFPGGPRAKTNPCPDHSSPQQQAHPCPWPLDGAGGPCAHAHPSSMASRGCPAHQR
jgi:hypothetical protein